jgi:hypothetical protein
MLPSKFLKNGAKIIHLAQFLGAFAGLWEVTVFVMSVCPFVCMEQIGFHWMGLHDIWLFFKNLSQKLEFHSN